MKKRKVRGIESLKQKYGLCFVAPWIFGIIVFFAIPLITSIIYSFSDVKFSSEGLVSTFAGLKHYRKLLFENPTYLDTLVESIGGIFTSLPIIIALSLMLAIVLNQKFHGRTFMRAIFFLPVIIASGVVISCMWTAGGGGFVSNVGQAGENTDSFMEVIDFEVVLLKLNLPQEMNDLLSGYLSNVFNLIWSCGIQSILFIAGLQTIPEQLYEVGKVEGATAWESFWYITIPMLSQVMLLVIFYTMIELFVSQGALVEGALNEMIGKNNMDQSSAQIWLYFVFVLILIGIVMWLYRRLLLKRWE